MKKLTNVRAFDTPPQELEINVDTVYKRYDIQSFERDGRTEYLYTEEQYTIPEYLKEIVPQNEIALGELSALLSVYQAQIDQAIAELSIAIGG